MRAAAALALLACAGCCKDDPIDTVVVLPQQVLTAPGVAVQFQAWAIDTAGQFMQPTPPTKWKGTASFVTSTTNPTQAAVASHGDHAIKAKIGKLWSLESFLRSQASSIEAPSTDAIEIEYASAASIADVLVDAKAAGDPDCGKANDRLYAIAKIGLLPENLIDGCATEIAVFVHDRAPLIETLAPGTWTTGPETLRRLPLPSTIPVPTAVWYFVDAENPQAKATVELEYANWAYAHNRAGLQLNPISHHATGSEMIYSGDTSCVGLPEDLGFEADKGHLHIVYMPEIPWAVAGWACPSDPERGDIVLLLWNPPFGNIITHEVVHQMGNSNPPFPWATSGHVDGYADFDVTNLMYFNNDPQMDEDRFSLTLGQVYRMHAAPESWLNRANLRPAGSTQKTCPGVPDAGVCPKLSLRGWR